MKRAKKLAALEPTEHESQAAFFRRVALHPKTKDLPVFAIPNGGHRHKATAAKLKAEGVKAGVPDIFVAMPKFQLAGLPICGLFIEMKRPGKKPTPAQEKWAAELRSSGYEVTVCYGCDEAWSTLCAYLGIAP